MQLYSAYRRVNDYLKTTAGATNATMICDLEMMLPPALGPGMRMHNGSSLSSSTRLNGENRRIDTTKLSKEVRC